MRNVINFKTSISFVVTIVALANLAACKVKTSVTPGILDTPADSGTKQTGSEPTIQPTNHAPGKPASISCTTASPLALSTLNTCTLTASSPADPDGDAVTYSDANSTCTAVVVDSATGAATFTAPAKNATCVVSVKAFDGTLYSDAVSSATITGANHPPVATPHSGLTVNDNATLSITLAGTDADSDALTYAVVAGPSHGSLTGTAPNLVYHPTAPYSGSDSFTFKANDGIINSSTATVSITVAHVNHAPVATAQSVNVSYNTATAITLAGTDADSDSLTYAVVDSPSNGSLSGSAPNLTYTPTTAYSGADTFTFKVNDGTVDSSIATISLTVAPYCSGSALANSPYAGGSGTSGDPYTICTATQMQAIGANSGNWAANFKLMANIDLSAYTGPEDASGNPIAGTPFNIIGNTTINFTGNFDGNGHVISNFTYVNPSASTQPDIGLFGDVSGDGTASGVIKNIGLSNVNVNQSGYTNQNGYSGGLVGSLISGSILNSYATGSVVGSGYAGAGGLVGLNGWGSGGGTISNSYAVCNVSGNGANGGLTSGNNGTITDSYAMGFVDGSSLEAGGIVGTNFSTITNSFASAAVLSGGFWGSGGAVAANGMPGTENASFWDITSSGQPTDGNGGTATGLSTSDILTGQSNYTSVVSGWSSSIWDVSNGNYPTLKNMPFGIQGLSTSMAVNGTANLLASGGNAGYAWSVTGCSGTFSTTTGSTTVFTAPASPGTCTVTLTDGDSNAVSQVITIN